MTNSQFLSRNTEPKLGPVKQPYFQLALALTDLGFLVLLNVTTWKLFFRVSAFLSISASHQQHQEQKQNLKDRISASHHLLAWDIFCPGHRLTHSNVDRTLSTPSTLSTLSTLSTPTTLTWQIQMTKPGVPNDHKSHSTSSFGSVAQKLFLQGCLGGKTC